MHKVNERIAVAVPPNSLISRGMPHSDILEFAPPLIPSRKDMSEIAAIARKSDAAICEELQVQGAISPFSLIAGTTIQQEYKPLNIKNKMAYLQSRGSDWHSWAMTGNGWHQVFIYTDREHN